MMILALLLLGAAASAAPANPGLLAVLELKNKIKGADREAIDGGYFADVIRTSALGAVPGLKVMTRENMVVLLQATGKKLDECEGECEVDTGRRLGADHIVSGEVLRIGKLYKINLRMHDTREGLLISGAQASGASPEELDRNVAAANKSLLAPLAPASPPAPPPAAAQPAATPSAQPPAALASLPAASTDCGSAAACGLEGDRRYSAKDFIGALPFYVRACELKDAAKCGQIGWQFDRGEGLPHDQRSALKYYELSCDLGSAGSCNNAGVAFREGWSGAPDNARAVERFRRACDLGDARACGSLGYAYLNGYGVPADPVAGLLFHSKACEAGLGNSCTSVGYQHGLGLGTPKSPGKAVAFYDKACKLDDGLGCQNQAIVVRDGLGAPADVDKARALFRRACELKVTSACAFAQ